MTAARIGILGGTGFGAFMEGSQAVVVDTPWGKVPVSHLRVDDIDLFFVQRHGADVRPPHRIVHRANVDALARCKVDAVLALNAVGAIDPQLATPALVVPHDLLDLRKTTETFHDARAVHVDMTEPYCPALRKLLAQEGVHDGGVYVAVEGPRIETPAEIRMMRALGGTLVGMTGAPEAALARERALCYASLCLVTNPAADAGAPPLRAQDLKAGAIALSRRAWDVVLAAARGIRHELACACRRALDGAAL